MSHTQLIRANRAQWHYVWALRAAYNRYSWIYDPDYASISDFEAWEKVRRDAVIAHAMEHRRHMVAGLEWRVVPVEDDPAGRFAARIMSDLLSETHRFHHARYNLAEAIFRGSSFAFIEGRRRPISVAGLDQMAWWVPEGLRHVDRWRFRITRTGGLKGQYSLERKRIYTHWEMFSVARAQWEKLKNPNWFVRHFYEQIEESMGYGRGLLQGIFYFWRAKEVALTQGLHGLERWAQGILAAAVDGAREGSTGRTNDEVADEWIDQLNKHRSQHVLVHDKRDEISVHTGGGEGHQIVMEFIRYLDNAVTQLILSSVLPTGGEKGTGSYNQAQEEAQQMETRVQADRQQLSEDIQDSLVRLVWERNIPTLKKAMKDRGLELPSRMPRFLIVNQKAQDPQANVGVITAALGIGVPLVKTEVYERLGFRQPTDDDEVISGAQDLPGGAGGGMPGGLEGPAEEELPQMDALDFEGGGEGDEEGGGLVLSAQARRFRRLCGQFGAERIADYWAERRAADRAEDVAGAGVRTGTDGREDRVYAEG